VNGFAVAATTDFWGISLNAPDFSLLGLAPYVALLILVLSAVAGMSIIQNARGIPKYHYSKSNAIERPDEAVEVMAILDQARTSLKFGSDYRGTVLNCYKAICRVLQRDTPIDDSRLTAREFESLAAKKLSVGQIYIHDVTALFERARYSDESISKGDSDRAQACLEGLRNTIVMQAIPQKGQGRSEI
jgi:Domain of unknown function (DUF4129)